VKKHVLLISCPDAKGLVHRITGVLFHNGLNILSNGEYVDHQSNHFFMRTEFEGEIDGNRILNVMQDFLPAGNSVRLTEARKKNIVVLATREHHCLGDLLIRNEFNELNARILGVISNHAALGVFVARFKVPFVHVPHEGLGREDHELRIREAIDGFAPEYIVLAKYMRVLTSQFVEAYPQRIINIHHSFLPAFVGSKPYQQAYERGVKIIGATAHYVNDQLDEGPIITQSILPVNHTYSAADMAQAGRDVEKVALANALRLVLDERVMIHGNKTIIFE
jgi:formyltetrahydrofolate deformylase